MSLLLSHLCPAQNTDPSFGVLASDGWGHHHRTTGWVAQAVHFAIRLADAVWYCCISHRGTNAHYSSSQMRGSFCTWSRGRQCVLGRRRGTHSCLWGFMLCFLLVICVLLPRTCVLCLWQSSSDHRVLASLCRFCIHSNFLMHIPLWHNEAMVAESYESWRTGKGAR